MNFLAGYKTYIAVGVAIIVAIAELIGIDVVPSIDQANALNALWAAVTAAFIRNGMPK